MIRILPVIVLACAAVVANAVSATAGDVTVAILFGWFAFLRRVWGEMVVRWDGVAVFAVGVVFFTVLLHRLVVWFRHETCEDGRRWRLRSTVLVVGLVLTSFVAGVSMIAATHQIVWIVGEDAPLTETALAEGYRTSRSNLREIGYAMSNYPDVVEWQSDRQSISSIQAQHSWATRILPFYGLERKMDLSKAWDHVDNQPEIRKLVPMLLNPGLRPAVLRDANGYGVSHYAGNKHLFDQPQQLSHPIIRDGTSKTLMIGEVSAVFQPWAKPLANRDPALGINRSPKGFGGPSPNSGALFLMADGSVEFISSDVDPRVLEALGTVDRGDSVDEKPGEK